MQHKRWVPRCVSRLQLLTGPGLGTLLLDAISAQQRAAERQPGKRPVAVPASGHATASVGVSAEKR